MTQLPVSIVIVSRQRPDKLKLCLTGIAQLCYPAFEVVVVTDADSIAAIQTLPFATLLKLIPFEEGNISSARNLGVAHAAGEVIAFIDDDAVPEPTWLTHLITPFAQSDIGAAGGYVRGRNGISYQWQGRCVDERGYKTTLAFSDDAPRIFRPQADSALKTEGTNMAVRRAVLVDLGGFDPAYHFFLDETDLNLRLAQAGYAVALVPRAQVHHSFSPSVRRRQDRTPLDIFDIGASWAVFQRKFVPTRYRAHHWRTIRATERARVMGFLIDGRAEPGLTRALLKRLDLGYSQGMDRRVNSGSIPDQPLTPFAPFPSSDGAHIFICARSWDAKVAREKARAARQDGAIVTLLLLSPTALYHHARFHSDGYWEQRGGQFGKSTRSNPLFWPWSFRARCDKERIRIERTRVLDHPFEQAKKVARQRQRSGDLAG